MHDAPTLITEDVYGLYGERWADLIVPEAMAHPAKFARGLVRWIVADGLAKGYWRKGDKIGDPFGGVGLGGIVCASAGLPWVGLEIEPRFHALGLSNFELHRTTWEASGDPLPRLLLGDSRKFAETVLAAAVISSPPYNGNDDRDSTVAVRDVVQRNMGFRGAGSYGRESGQIAQLPTGSADAVISSPPFTMAQGGGAGINVKGYGPDGADKVGSRTYQGTAGEREPGNIEALQAGSVDAVISSPVYAECVKGDHGEQETAEDTAATRRTAGGSLGASQRNGGYGKVEGQIGTLKAGDVDAVVSSPPYGDSDQNYAAGWKHIDPAKAVHNRHSANREASYGDTEGNIGTARGETYWSAMRAVYASVRDALRPGGVCAWVLKDYVSKGKRVPLCDDTARLLEAVGFTVFRRVRAMLVAAESTTDLFDAGKVHRSERKGFFRRLAEKKGSPRIDWEEVIYCIRPAAAEGGR